MVIKEDLQGLIRSLKHEDSGVRYRAVLDLKVMALEDGNEHVRYEAARALGEIGDRRAVEPIVKALKKDEAGTVRYNAAWALGRIGDSRAVEPLTRALDDHEKAFPYSVSVREAAKKALERIDAKKS